MACRPSGLRAAACACALAALLILSWFLKGGPVPEAELVQGRLQSLAGLAVTPLATTPSIAKSTHTCLGSRHPPAFPWPWQAHDNRTCLFRNVCIDSASDERVLLYLTDSEKDFVQVGEYFSEPEGTELTTPDLRPLCWPGLVSCVHVPLIRVHPAWVASRNVSVFPHNVTVLFQPFGSENIGHHLGDNMFAIFAMQQLLHVDDPVSSQLMMWEGCDTGHPKDGKSRKGCGRMIAKLYTAISSKPVLYMKTSVLLGQLLGQDNLHSKPLVCFPNLILGSGTNSYRNPAGFQSRPFFAYRSFMLQNLIYPCHGRACTTTVLDMKRIIFLVRGNGSRDDAGIRNIPGLVAHLSLRLPNYTIESQDLALLTFSGQAALIARAYIMFTSAGGGSFVGIFLNQGASIAIQFRGLETIWRVVELRLWKSLHWLTVYDIPGLLCLRQAEEVLNKTGILKLDQKEANLSSGLMFPFRESSLCLEDLVSGISFLPKVVATEHAGHDWQNLAMTASTCILVSVAIKFVKDMCCTSLASPTVGETLEKAV